MTHDDVSADDRACHYCGRAELPDEDYRPYGPGATWVCYDCAMLPENVQTTTNAFNAVADQARSISGVVVLGPNGLQPVSSLDELNALINGGGEAVIVPIGDEEDES